MITPTVGRVVLLARPSSTLDAAQPECGLITWVHDERRINVVGFNKNGVPFTLTDVLLEQDEDLQHPSGDYAYWMLYQKAVAADTIPPVLHAEPSGSPPPPLEGSGPMESVQAEGNP
jgi:hypothetical protein